MEYVDDPQDIEESLKALDRVRDWAHEQMGKMRQPHAPEMPAEEGEMSEELGEGTAPDDFGAPSGDEQDQGFEEAPMGEELPEKELTVIATGPKAPPRAPPQGSARGMDGLGDEAMRRLDKFGRKRR